MVAEAIISFTESLLSQSLRILTASNISAVPSQLTSPLLPPRSFSPTKPFSIYAKSSLSMPSLPSTSAFTSGSSDITVVVGTVVTESATVVVTVVTA